MSKWLTRIALAVLAFLSAVLGIFAGVQNTRAKKAEAGNKANEEALSRVKEKAGRLKKASKENESAKGKADEERKSLEDTPDSDLARRANKLF